MPARRKHQHARLRPLKWNTKEYEHEGLAAQTGGEAVFTEYARQRWRQQAGRYANQPKTLAYYPTPNGMYEPLTVALLVDCLLRLDPGSYINASALEGVLNDEYPAIMWDAYTVGRILAELHGFAKDVAEAAPNDELPPLDRLLYGSNKQYVLSQNLIAWKWLGAVREYFYQAAKLNIEATREAGKTLPRKEGIWFPVADIKWGDEPRLTSGEINEIRRKAQHAARSARTRRKAKEVA